MAGFGSPPVWSQAFSVPNTFAAGTPASAADVNANFSAAATAINGKQGLVTGTCPVGHRSAPSPERLGRLPAA